MSVSEMRTENEIIDLIKHIAAKDDRVRAVLLNGSRANPQIEKDIFCDYDILFMVHTIQSFLANHSWIDIFGERLILQMPDDMAIPANENHDGLRFSYLMLFKDGSRIDLTLFPLEEIVKYKPDSLTVVLSNKDNLFNHLPAPSEAGYLIQKPTQKEFSDCCNEFWWVITYVAKGLWRQEITYAKDMFEKPVRAMFLTMLEWHAGINTHFSVSAGKSGKYLPKYFDSSFWNKITATYPNADPSNIWASLFTMTTIFRSTAKEVAEQLNYTYNMEEDNNVSHYLREVKAMKKKNS
jgi:aminoglycoside 6-adenylyltransferase